MAGKTNGKNGYREFGYSVLRLLSTVFVESFKNPTKTTQIAIKSNGNGEKVICVSRLGVEK